MPPSRPFVSSVLLTLASSLLLANVAAAQFDPFLATRIQLDPVHHPSDADFGSFIARSFAFGDFNGDGYEDLAAGFPGATVMDGEVPLYQAGVVWVFEADADGIPERPTLILHQGVTAGGLEANERFGQSVAAGDFDGDGDDELAIGAFLDDFSGESSAGLVVVLEGSGTGLQLPGTVWHQGTPGVQGALEPGDHFGLSLVVGDFDGFEQEGVHYDDLAIGSPGEDVFVSGVGDVVQGGAVNVLYGSSSGLTAAGDQIFSLENLGLDTGAVDRWGDVLGAGDFDGDGDDELVVSAPQATVSGDQYAGKLVVLEGGLGGLSSPTLWHQDVAGIPDGPDPSDYFGFSLAVGRFDDDVYEDLAIGVIGENTQLQPGAGLVHVIYGSSGGLDAVGIESLTQASTGLSTPEAADQFGYALAAGDFDGDGLSDLAVSSPQEEVDLVIAGLKGFEPPDHGPGAIQIVFGTPDGLLPLSTVTEARWLDQSSPGFPGTAASNDAFGSVLAAGNATGSGTDELALGIPYDDNNVAGSAAGSVVLLRSVLFFDGFESGSAIGWSSVTP